MLDEALTVASLAGVLFLAAAAGCVAFLWIAPRHRARRTGRHYTRVSRNMTVLTSLMEKRQREANVGRQHWPLNNEAVRWPEEEWSA